MKFKDSILRQLSMAFLAFGTSVGAVFPFYAEYFVEWKPGMYGWFFLGCLIAGGMIGVVNYILVKAILLKKLKRIAEISYAIRDKDLRHTCTVKSDDLIGEIINSFNSMSETLRDMIGRINSEASYLNSSSDSLMNYTSAATNSTQQQQSQVEQIATAINQMSATAQEVASHAEQTANSIKEANEQSDNAKVVVVEAMTSVDVLADMVGTASDVITNLEKEGENIGNVLTVISGIAEQTNLLALNAAIEAARAGEQGRGFAVVADEVRTLANRTKESTTEISDMIERLQNGTREAANTMEQSREQAVKGVDYTEQAAEALAMISGNINTINEMSTHIANAAEEQKTVVEDINQNVVMINDGSIQATENMNQVNQSSHDVAQHAVSLHQLIEGFKV